MATAIIAILAAAALPSAKLFARRQREVELRRALREIRTAIDAYHRAAQGPPQRIKIEGGVANAEEPYPKELAVLVEGADPNGPQTYKIKFLRRIPKDPFNVNNDDSDDSGWRCRSYQDDSDSSSWGKQNVFDVFSNSEGRAIDGSNYKDW